MKIRSPLLGLSLTLLLSLEARVFAQDASIDQLLKKLPPPEKFAKSPVERALQQPDPADKDPLLKDIVQALRMRNGQRAFNLSHQLIQRHPESPAAYCINAIIAAGLRQYAEASSNLRKAIELRPNLAFAYFLLGDVEATQQHFGAALPHFQKVAELEPKNPIAWIYLSACAEKAGRKQESLDVRETRDQCFTCICWRLVPARALREFSWTHKRSARCFDARGRDFSRQCLSPDDDWLFFISTPIESRRPFHCCSMPRKWRLTTFLSIPSSVTV